ncbi:MAG: DUF4872 domain-containing protein [Gemmatimonadales bacterium]|nr:DUF4872 domain-containing protein [Gemmatimonadales bacterium]
MTERKHFKQLVRGRMSKTGESYSAARRQIIRQAPDSPTPERPFIHYPGSVPVSTALRVLLANAGIKNPHTKAPFSEAMVFGLDGGIGAGVFAFHYAKEKFSSFYIAGRHGWQDDAHWSEEARNRLGVKSVVKESSGAKAGEKHLRELLATGQPVMAWVDSASLPYRAMPKQWQGGGYHVITIYTIDDASGTALIGDQADEPIAVSLADLAQARGRIKKFKNRLLAIGPAKKGADLGALVRGSLRACVDGLVTCKMKNYRLDAFLAWAEKLDGSKAADAWDKIFPPGPLLYTGLWSVYEFIEHWGGGGLCRPVFAEFLHEAGAALKDRRLTALGDSYADLGRDWTALANAALPDEVPAFRQTKELLARKSEFLHEQTAEATEEVARAWAAFGEEGERMKKAFPLDAAQSRALRRELKRRVVALHEAEVAALEALGAWL